MPPPSLSKLWIIAAAYSLLASLQRTQGLLSLPFVLKQAGKTVFRPGGMDATRQLLHWAKTTNSSMIQVISPYNNSNTALPHLPSSSVLLLEAILTHQPDATKDELLQSLPCTTQQLLLHDVCIIPNNATTTDDLKTTTQRIRRDLTHALGTGFYALSVDEWKQLVQRNGFRVTECQQGPQPSMSLKRLIQEEGWWRAVRIVWNLMTHPQWRERVKFARTTMSRHNDSLGYIILRAIKANTTLLS